MVKPSNSKKNFPSELDALHTLLKELKKKRENFPPEVQRVADSGRASLLSDKPRASISKRFCGLRTAHPQMFPIVTQWLNLDLTAALFNEFGFHWARVKLLKAFQLITDGEKPHVAFGMDKGGAPSMWGFTAIEDAAMYAQDLHVNHDYSIDNAKMVAAKIFCTDKANINKVKTFKDASASDIEKQAQYIKLKYKDKYKF